MININILLFNMNQVAVELWTSLNNSTDSYEHVIKRIDCLISKDYDMYYELIFVKLSLKNNDKKTALDKLEKLQDRKLYGSSMFVNRIKKGDDIGTVNKLPTDIICLIEQKLIPSKPRACRKLF